MSGRTHSKRFRLRRDSVPKVRRHVQATLTQWKLAAVADDAELIISETGYQRRPAREGHR